jgi:hypothetical protein
VVPLLPQLLEALPLVMPLLLRRLRKRRRKRVRSPRISIQFETLTCFIAKEESDEDMGFGLFD